MKKIKNIIISLIPYLALSVFIAGFIFISSKYPIEANSNSMVKLDREIFSKTNKDATGNFSVSSINAIPLTYKSVSYPFIIKNNLIFSYFNNADHSPATGVVSLNMMDKSIENLISLSSSHITEVYPSPDNKKFLYGYYSDLSLDSKYSFRNFSIYNLETKDISNSFSMFADSVSWLSDSKQLIGTNFSSIFITDLSIAQKKIHTIYNLGLGNHKAQVKYVIPKNILVSNNTAYFFDSANPVLSIALDDFTLKNVHHPANIIYDAKMLNNGSILFSGLKDKLNNLYIYNPSQESSASLINNPLNLVISCFSVSPDNKKICYVLSEAYGNKEIHTAYLSDNKLSMDTVVYKTTDTVSHVLWTNDSLKLVAITESDNASTVYKFNFKNIK